MKLYFDEYTADYHGELTEQIEITFGQSLKVIFVRDGSRYLAANAVNGWGHNVMEKYVGQELYFIISSKQYLAFFDD